MLIAGFHRPQAGEQIRRLGVIEKRFHLDLPMLFLILILSLIGLVVLYSAAGQNFAMVQRQVIRILFSLLVMLVVAQLSPHVLLRWTPVLYGAGVLLLVAVATIGATGKGAQRWLDLGFFRFQPSEVMKVVVPMMVSWYLYMRPMPPSFKRIGVSLVIIMLPTILILIQPDLGTSILIAGSGFFVLFFAGLSWRIILSMIPVGMVTGLLGWFFFMHDYQRRRVLTFLNPENDPLGAGYHIIQSKIAIGSGGTFGKGWLNGTQSQLNFLPERSTDFIFSAFSEEFGFVGVVILLTIYLLLVMRCLYVATRAQDSYSRLLCGSLSLTLFVYVFVNVGMVSGLLPVVGLPLPMVSYGGTSMVIIMAAFGILMSTHTHLRLHAT
jgi:rod shape determining protein RodA